MITYKLSEIARSSKGKKPKSVSKEKTYSFAIPYVDIKAFEKGIIDNYTDGENCIFCKPDDVLIVWDGARCGFVGRGVEGAIGSTLAKISSDKYTNDFLFYFFQSKYKILNSNPRGVGIPHIEPNLLWNFEIPDIDKPTQRAIVARIESLFAELDKGVEKLKTAQQQLKVYRQAVLNDCLTKGSEKWEKVKLGEVIERIEAGKSFRCSEKVPSKNEKGIVKISAVTWGEFLEMECKTIVNEEFYNPNYRIHKGDLLISRANTLQLVGSCVFVRKEPNRDIVLSDKVLRLIPKQNADSRFLLYSLRTSNSRKQIQTMSTGNQDSMRNIGQDRLKKINLECPSLPEQQRIVQEIETRLSACDEVEKNINESLQQSEALRQSILKKAFSGELV